MVWGCKDLGKQCLGPILWGFCARLDFLLNAYAGRNAAGLFVCRGGFRLHHLYRLYLNSRNRTAPIPIGNFFSSRISALILSQANPNPITQQIMAQQFIGVDKTRWGHLLQCPVPHIDAWQHTDNRHSDNIAYFTEQKRRAQQHITTVVGPIAQAVLIDTGWRGTIQALLRHSLPSISWFGAYLGHWQPPEPQDSWGLLCHHRGRDRCRDVVRTHRHIFEMTLEPAIPSFHHYPETLPDPTEQTVIAGGTPAWQGVLDYFHERQDPSLCRTMADSKRAWKILYRTARRPSRGEITQLGCSPRSDDLGRDSQTSVLHPRAVGFANKRRNIQQALWPEAQGRLEWPKAPGLLLPWLSRSQHPAPPKSLQGHLDQIRQQLQPHQSQGKSVALFGAGGHGPVILEHLLRRGLPVAAIYDNNPQHWGRCIATVPVLPPDHIREDIVVIGSVVHRQIIAEQLKAHNTIAIPQESLS